MKLRDWRNEHGVSAADLAEMCGVAETTIRSYESGARRPKAELAQRIEQITGGAVLATDLVGLTGMRGVAESPAEFTLEEPPRAQTMAEIRAERLAPQPVTIGVPKDLLDLSREYGLDVEALIVEGGLPRLRQVFKETYMERNREAIEWTNEYVRKYGTLSEQLGMI